MPVLYNVIGGGSYISGGSGVAIGVSNSQIGVNYHLMLGGINNGTTLAGTGNILSFANKTVVSVYTVKAIIVTTVSKINMIESATVTINQTPIKVTRGSASPTSASISVSATQLLTATVLPAIVTNKTVSWKSVNTLVASVNTYGLITGIAVTI